MTTCNQLGLSNWSTHPPDLVELVVDALDAREQWLSCQHLNKDTAHSPGEREVGGVVRAGPCYNRGCIMITS